MMTSQGSLTLFRRVALAFALFSLFSRYATADDDLRFWLQNMIWDHGYSIEESAEGLNLSEDEVRRLTHDWKITPESKPAENFPPVRIKVRPWAPGRHPRIGFLDGAIDPLRDTKLSIFLPWPDSGFVVFDIPEAIFSNLGLIWLAHTHIPTIWDTAGVKLDPVDWIIQDDGTLEFERTLPNKISFGVKVTPSENEVLYEYWLSNGTDAPLTGLRSQLCVLLKNAPDFNDQIGENKLLVDGAATVHSRDGKHWIVTECERSKPWQNPPCPCMHADPTFEDCLPSARVSVRGRISFHESDNLPERFKSIKSD